MVKLRGKAVKRTPAGTTNPAVTQDIATRINIRHPYVRLSSLTGPDPVGDPTFVDNDLYLSGHEHLRRIRKLVPTP